MVDSTAAFDRGIDEPGERTLGPENSAFVPALMNLAAARILGGKLDDAEALVLRALGVSENGPAQNDPDFVILLNDLIRLSLKQSAHAVAEPLLLRLLAIKRSKGEEHPEVATVLASLATLRQGLGRHESAEQLWRRVLEIRERTLAPNHFALAIALERLAEACAARGKIGEALELLQRAHGVRELTLGVDHSSLRVSRDRIADLQLQASEETLDVPASESSGSAPERYRLLSADHSVAIAPRPARTRNAVKQWKAMAPGIEREPAKEGIAEPLTPLPMDEVPAADGQSPEPGPAPYLDVLLSIREELGDDYQVETLKGRAAEIFTSVLAAVKQRQKMTVIGVSAMALLAGSAAVSYARNARELPGVAQEASTLSGIGSLQAASASEVSNSPLILSSDPTRAPATASAAATPVGPSRTPIADQRTPAKRSRKGEPMGISIPDLPSSLTAGFDQVVRTRTASELGVAESIPVLPAPMTGNFQRPAFQSDDQVAPPQRAFLIGALPAPRYPNYLIGVQGDVSVRFDVDASGLPVIASLSVVNSSNELFTAEVLEVIPGLRFEPAHSGGSDSKAVRDVVVLRFHFRPTK